MPPPEVPPAPPTVEAPAKVKMEAEAKAKNAAAANLGRARIELEMPRRLRVLRETGGRLTNALSAPARPGSTVTMQQALDAVATQTGLDTDAIIRAITADLPAIPGPGESIGPRGNDAVLVRVVQPSVPVPDDAIGGAIHVNTDDVMVMIRNVDRVAPLCAGNEDQREALSKLRRFLTDYMMVDRISARREENAQLQRNSVTARGLRFMGTVAAAGVLGSYVLITGAVGLANRKFPFETGIAAGLLYFLVNPTARRDVLAPQQRVILEETEAFTKTFVANFDTPNRICADGQRWAPVFEEWIRSPQRTTDFINALNSRTVSDTEKREYIEGLGVSATNPLYSQILAMINTRRPGTTQTDLERLTSLLGTVRRREAQEAVLNFIRTNRGQRQASPAA